MTNKIVFINDLHFGINDTEREVEELNKHFLPFIKNNDVDVIFLGGDYFDHKLSLGEPASLLGLEFFNNLISIAKEKNIIIRVIEGTQSHDRFQPRILENLVDSEVDYRLFETVGVEDVLGMRVLYVPEEYPMNIDEYYAPYKTDKFDLMVVHGTWDFINFGGSIDNNRNDINTAPVFKYQEWKDALEHGVALCGHIHGRHGYKDKTGEKIIYPGSFTAWSFDQISPRGFLYGEFDTETHKLKYEFVNNPDSPKYANLDVSDLGIDLENTDVETIKNKIAEQKEKVNFIKVNLDALSEDKKMILKEYYKGIKEIKTEVSTKKMLTESAANKYEKYNYLLEDKLAIEKAIQKFIKEDLDQDLSEDEIKEILQVTK